MQQGKEEEFLLSDSPKEGVKGSIQRFVWLLGWIKGMKLYPWRLRTEWVSFVSSAANFKGASLKLLCSTESLAAGFNQASSFMMEIGISECYPISCGKKIKEEFSSGTTIKL